MQILIPSCVVNSDFEVVEVAPGLFEVRGAYEGTFDYFKEPVIPHKEKLEKEGK